MAKSTVKSRSAPRFRLTYSTMFDPPEALHTSFEKALAAVKADLGRDYPMLIGGRERFSNTKFEDRSPINTAWLLGTILMLTGLACAAIVSMVALGIATFIAGMTFFYNAWSKRFALLGPLSLGTCRFANFLLGMRCCPPRLWYAPAILGVYVTILTYIARSEVINPAVRVTVKRLLLGIIVVDAALAGNPFLLLLLIPAIALSKLLPMT